MVRRIVAVLGAVMVLVVISAADAQAARYRGSSHLRFRSPYAHRYNATRRVPKRCIYPRVRRIDGRTLWDLGKQKGQWPSLP